MAPRQQEQQSLLEDTRRSSQEHASQGEEFSRESYSYGSAGDSAAAASEAHADNTTSHERCLHSTDALILTMDEAIERLGYGRFQNYLLWAAGLCMMADGLEVLLLSFLTLVLRTSSDWNLTDLQTDSIVASVFLGAMFGSLVLGHLADRFGRKPLFTVTAAMIAVFGLATGAAPNYSTLLLCRFWVGFGVGGLTVPFDTLSEFIPGSHRGHNLLAIEFFWTTGTMLVVILAYFTLGQGTSTLNDFDDAAGSSGGFGEFWHGWRVFVVLCAVPCIFSTLWGLWCVPESPRWLIVTKKDPKAALKVLRDAAAINGHNPMELFPPHTQLVSGEGEAAEGGAEATFWDLLSPRWIKTTLCLWGTWFGFGLLYYGGVIATTLVFANSQSAIHRDNSPSSTTYHFDYGALFVANSAEIVGTALIVLTVDTVGRIPIQYTSYLVGGISVLTLCLLASSDDADYNFFSIMVVLAFGTRMLMMCGSCTTWLSTAEILTTDIRSTGHSTANAMARVGGFLCPYLVSPSSSLTTIGVSMFGIALFTAFCSWNLPETKGLDLGSATLKKPQQPREGGFSLSV